mgnify:FL=1
MTKENQRAFLRFAEFLTDRSVPSPIKVDFRDYVLAKRDSLVGIGYVPDTLETGFGANLRRLFPRAVSLTHEDFERCDTALLSGTIYRLPERSHKGTLKALNVLPPYSEFLLFEGGFLATSHSWPHAFREKNPAYACLGYVFDDIAHYFMADYPNRLIRKLNGPAEITADERARARALIDRIVRERVSKYNAQPMTAPERDTAWSWGVLGCDQSYA